MTVRRPIESLSHRIVETGIVFGSADKSVADAEPTVAMYAVLEGNMAVMIEPRPSAGPKLGAVPDHLKPILWARYADRKLVFPSDPLASLTRKRPLLPLQHVDPRRINLVYAGHKLEKLMRRRGQVEPGDWDSEVASKPFAESGFYRALESHFKDGIPWSELPELEAVMKGEDATIVSAAIDRLHNSIKSEGYRSQSQLGGADGDEIQAALGQNGRYILLSGAKRLAIARLLGLPSVPVNVTARHSKWEAERRRIVSFAGKHEGRVYQRLLHPDLLDIQAHHDTDRLPIIKRALEGYDPKGKALMDIGAHWGQMSAAMEELGFDVTAVEQNTQSARVTRLLRDAMEHRFEVWEGSVFEFPKAADQNVVLALNIFHHFLKSKENYEALEALLGRLNADILIFAAHAYDRRGPEFETAYRNFPPVEFANFVSKHSRLPKVELMGKSHDGRSLFKLTRK